MPPFQIQTTTIACTRYLLKVLQLPSGATYDGTFSKGLPNGIGVQAVKYRLLTINQHFQVMRFPDSSRYEGEFMQVDWVHRYNLYLLVPCATLLRMSSSKRHIWFGYNVTQLASCRGHWSLVMVKWRTPPWEETGMIWI